MDLLGLQIWGGGFYLLNKIFLAISEGREKSLQRKLKIAAWSTYLIGLPAIVWLFSVKHRWIAAFLEAGGGPAMLLGLILALRGIKDEEKPGWVKYLDYLALLTAIIGIGVSLWEYGRLDTKEQAMELGLVIGFLAGTYLLSKNIPWGYFCYMGMNVCCIILMYWDNRIVIVGQQIISFSFVTYGAYRGFFTHPKQTE